MTMQQRITVETMKFHTQILFALQLLFPICVVASNELPLEPYPSDLIAEVAVNQSLAEATVPQLRAIARDGEFSRQIEALKALVAKGDDATVARLVYALRQGNAAAEDTLMQYASLPMVNYLLEDVAHGSMERYYGDGNPLIGQVRVAATAIVTKALANTPELPADTVEWFQYLARTGYPRLAYVPEQSQAVIDWWSHNASAMQSGNLDKATWQPTDKELIPAQFNSCEKSRIMMPLPPPPALPLIRPTQPSLPFSLAETFPQWVARVSNSSNLDLRVAKVDFDGRLKERVPKELRNSSPMTDQRVVSSTLNANQATGDKSSSSLLIWSIEVFLFTVSCLFWLSYKKRAFRSS